MPAHNLLLDAVYLITTDAALILTVISLNTRALMSYQLLRLSAKNNRTKCPTPRGQMKVISFKAAFFLGTQSKSYGCINAFDL